MRLGKVVARTVARLSHWVYFNSRLKVTKESCWRDLFFVCREWALGENTHICIKERKRILLYTGDRCAPSHSYRGNSLLKSIYIKLSFSTYRSWQKTGMGSEEPKWSSGKRKQGGLKNAPSLPQIRNHCRPQNKDKRKPKTECEQWEMMRLCPPTLE